MLVSEAIPRPQQGCVRRGKDYKYIDGSQPRIVDSGYHTCYFLPSTDYRGHSYMRASAVRPPLSIRRLLKPYTQRPKARSGRASGRVGHRLTSDGCECTRGPTEQSCPKARHGWPSSNSTCPARLPPTTHHRLRGQRVRGSLGLGSPAHSHALWRPSLESMKPRRDGSAATPPAP